MLVLLKRVFVQDLNESTTQWREYLFDTEDQSVSENLVINSSAFSLTSGDLVWTDPLTGDVYTYNGAEGVNLTPGPGPITTPTPPDLGDYGLRFVLEYFNWNQEVVREEIYKRDYVGASEEVEGGATPFTLNYENGGKVFVPFRGSRATVTLKSDISKYYAELFDGDERDFYLIHKVAGVSKWTGWITPDNFTEVYGNAPYMTVINFSDGIGMAKDLDFPDANLNRYTGTITEKDAVCAALSQIALSLEVRIACNLQEQGMDLLSVPMEQSSVNMETFTIRDKGEITPLDCYAALDKILRSWNAVLIQEDNIWWVVREPELYGATLNFKRFQPDGTPIGTGTKSLENTFASAGIKLNGANLQTMPAFRNIAVSQEYGDLLVANSNFAANGSFEKWTPVYYDGDIRGWKLTDWVYSNLTPRIKTGSNWSGSIWTGNVRRIEESTGLDEVNNFINIYGATRNFTEGADFYLESKPTFVKQEVGNVIKVNFKTRCNALEGKTRLVEAYFNIAVKCGTQYLKWEQENDILEWTSTPTRIRWKVAEVMRWETITIPEIAIPEDGDLSIRLHPIVQVGSVKKVLYVADYDDVELLLADNSALLNQRVYYKTINDKTFTSKVEEIKIQLGDVVTVLSQNAKIVNEEPTSAWSKGGDYFPLAQLIAQEYVNQTNVSRYRLSGGRCRVPLSFLGSYEDNVNEPGRKFILTGGTFDAKTGEIRPDFYEINQTDVEVTIREVEEQRDSSGTGQGADRPSSDNGSSGPEEPQTEAPENGLEFRGQLQLNSAIEAEVIEGYDWMFDGDLNEGGTGTIVIPSTPTTHNRRDALVGDSAGNYHWIEGTESASGVLDPTIPSNRRLLEYILRTPAGVNIVEDVEESDSRYVDKISTGNQTILSDLTLAKLATPNPNRLTLDANGKIMVVDPTTAEDIGLGAFQGYTPETLPISDATAEALRYLETFDLPLIWVFDGNKTYNIPDGSPEESWILVRVIAIYLYGTNLRKNNIDYTVDPVGKTIVLGSEVSPSVGDKLFMELRFTYNN